MPHTLLLADDNAAIQRVVELIFADQDIAVVAVSDGDAAIAAMNQSPADIVLADVGLPGRSGYDVARHVKQTPALAHVPVLLLAGAFEPIDSSRAADADGVLTKPIEPQAVVRRVRELLARSAAGAPALPVPGPFVMPEPEDLPTLVAPEREDLPTFVLPEDEDMPMFVTREPGDAPDQGRHEPEWMRSFIMREPEAIELGDQLDLHPPPIPEAAHSLHELSPEPLAPEPALPMRELSPEPPPHEPLPPEPLTPEPLTPEPLTPEPLPPEPLAPESPALVQNSPVLLGPVPPRAPDVESFFEELDLAFSSLAVAPRAPLPSSGPSVEQQARPPKEEQMRPPKSAAPPVSLVDAFATLLAKELAPPAPPEHAVNEPMPVEPAGLETAQTEHAPLEDLPVWTEPAPAEPALLNPSSADDAAIHAIPALSTDELIERVTQQALERLPEDAVRAMVERIVTTTAERLIREEIERIKSNIK